MAYETTTVPTDALQGFIADIFAAAGCERPEGEPIAHHLLSRYIIWLQEGKVRAGQTLTVVHKTPTQAIGGGTSGPIPGGKRGRIANGMQSIYLSPGSFGAAGFSDAVHDYARYVKASRPAEAGSEVLIPGEPEARNREDRRRNVIPLQVETWAAICDTARSLGLHPPAVAVPNA
jgi:LDH2 family malate/lactate/ureidoglycolate dehydrogenase